MNNKSLNPNKFLGTDKDAVFVNEDGQKFWLDETINSYIKGKRLKNLVCYIVEEPNGDVTRLLVKDDVPFHEDASIEGMASKIDIILFIERE